MTRADTRSRQWCLVHIRYLRTDVPGLEQYGGLTRARHIHIKVLPFLNIELTTQLYFKGDEHLATDPWGAHKPSLALDLKQDSEFMIAEFDFVLGTGLKG